jgi:chemotaxis protein methyltransferase WspC
VTQPDFKCLLRDTIGLDIGSIGNKTLDRAVQSRMASFGFEQSQAYWEYLQSSTDEIQELIESVVVLETWFFRDRDAFSAMVRLISPLWQESPSGPPFRVLSVPCCTGEEPYSIAIALVEAGLASSRIQVDAADISRQAILRAKRGVYGSNSFRGEDLAFRDRYLERAENGYVVPQWLRGLVTFHHENLLSPSFRTDASPYDIIFCRNVLIYFDRANQEAAMSSLNRLLKPNGYLFVGPAETVLASRSGFRPLNETMSFAFSKEQHHSVPKVRLVRSPLKADRGAPILISPKGSGAVVAEIAVPSKIGSRAKEPFSGDVEQIKNLADGGHFDEALTLCEKYLDERGQAAEVYYLLALINDNKGETARAIDWYRKVLYLEPGHSDALMHLALLHERVGDAASAKRLRDRALRSESTENHTRLSDEVEMRRRQ